MSDFLLLVLLHLPYNLLKLLPLQVQLFHHIFKNSTDCLPNKSSTGFKAVVVLGVSMSRWESQAAEWTVEVLNLLTRASGCSPWSVIVRCEFGSVSRALRLVRYGYVESALYLLLSHSWLLLHLRIVCQISRVWFTLLLLPLLLPPLATIHK